MAFYDALKLAMEGKLIRREAWKEDEEAMSQYWVVNWLTLEDIEASDWLVWDSQIKEWVR